MKRKNKTNELVCEQCRSVSLELFPFGTDLRICGNCLSYFLNSYIGQNLEFKKIIDEQVQKIRQLGVAEPAILPQKCVVCSCENAMFRVNSLTQDGSDDAICYDCLSKMFPDYNYPICIECGQILGKVFWFPVLEEGQSTEDPKPYCYFHYQQKVRGEGILK